MKVFKAKIRFVCETEVELKGDSVEQVKLFLESSNFIELREVGACRNDTEILSVSVLDLE